MGEATTKQACNGKVDLCIIGCRVRKLLMARSSCRAQAPWTGWPKLHMLPHIPRDKVISVQGDSG